MKSNARQIYFFGGMANHTFMKYLLLFTFLSACSPSIPPIKVGECVLGTNMAVWKLLREAHGMFLFVQYPEVEGAPVHSVTDVAAFKKVDCPVQVFM
jgi:hypothetical protein